MYQPSFLKTNQRRHGAKGAVLPAAGKHNPGRRGRGRARMMPGPPTLTPKRARIIRKRRKIRRRRRRKTGMRPKNPGRGRKNTGRRRRNTRERPKKTGVRPKKTGKRRKNTGRRTKIMRNLCSIYRERGRFPCSTGRFCSTTTGGQGGRKYWCWLNFTAGWLFFNAETQRRRGRRGLAAKSSLRSLRLCVSAFSKKCSTHQSDPLPK